jgi:FkbM family methyltransferase
VSVRWFIRGCLWRMGWDLRPFDPNRSEWAQLVRQLAVHEVNTVLDVGANVGQFARKLRDSGFRGKIVSFEATSAAYVKLREEAKADKDWIVAPRAAIGDCDGTTTIHVSANSAASSVLPMLPAHADAAPESRYVTSEEVMLCKLDTISRQFVRDDDRVFVKLDVQGFEYQVLQGATELLTRIIGLQLEHSLVPLYDGEHLFHPMLHELEERGFELWSLVPGFVDGSTGRLLQVDGIFFRPDGLARSRPVSSSSTVS